MSFADKKVIVLSIFVTIVRGKTFLSCDENGCKLHTVRNSCASRQTTSGSKAVQGIAKCLPDEHYVHLPIFRGNFIQRPV